MLTYALLFIGFQQIVHARTIVIQHGHVFVQRMCTAREQLSATTHFEHVVLFSGDDSEKCKDLLKRADCLHGINVSCTTIDILKHRFPSIHKPTAKAWAWFNCDLLYFDWLSKQHLLTDDIVFTIEYDVSWNGNLLELLHKFDNNTSDLLCGPNIGSRDSNWIQMKHKGIHSHARVFNRELRACLVQLMRIKGTLIIDTLQALPVYNNVEYCESRLASACLHTPSCTMDSIDVIGKSYFGPFSWNTLVTSETMKHYPTPAFFHRSKW